ncbi:MAG: beta-glucosidase BglX [Clostridia bacterium]|nr:beta-glucosidase BglX [Clostridia bacterium]
MINIKDKEIKELLNEMTIDEKIGQMVQVAGDIFLEDDINVSTGPLKNLELSEEKLYNVGSILNVIGAERVKKIQDKYLSKNRLKIPLLFMDDIINGYKIAFPIPIAQGCSWNLEVLRNIAKISAMESNIAGANVNFSPMVDLSRDARWGRVMESVGGEDPYLGKVYAKATVKAYQGEDISRLGNIASCVKHIAAYGAVEAGRDYNTVDMSEREFRQYYLPAYKEAIENGAEMLMTSFNILNGVPATVNKWLIQDLLRKELKFKGVIISDYGAIEETIAHGFSKNEEYAALNAIKAGVDIDMMSKIYANYLKKWCLEDKEIENKVNESVLRILNLKNKLGLFENPYSNADVEKEKRYIMNKTNLEKAKKLTQETFVLLKNKDNVLPLNNNSKIALIGPYADNIAITGSWSMFSDKTKNSTILDVVKNKVGNENVLYSKGTEILRCEEINKILKVENMQTISIDNEPLKEKEAIEKAKEVAEKSDIIILLLGEHYKQSGEACSRSNIGLPENQVNLINELYKLNKKMVMVLFNGRPIQLNNVENKLDAILEVWFPGTTGAEAITEVLFGDVNPSGKLTMSFPQNVGQCPIYYNHYSTGRPHNSDFKYLSRYQDIETESFYPFGYGLSYCKFIYSNLQISKSKMRKDESILVGVDVENKSQYEGYEIIEMYIQDLYASVVRPVKELKGFQKVFFKPFEKKKIEFEINSEMLKFWNNDLKYVVESGEFKVFIGSSSKDTLEEKFEFID